MILDYLVSFAVYACIYFIVVGAFNLSYGFTGLVNLGHMVFFGIGAYSSAILTINGVSWYFAIIISALIASAIGSFIAAVTVRLKGDYFQVATLGLIFMAIAISRNWISLTRGALGIPGIPRIFSNNLYFLLLAFLIAAASILFFLWLVKSNTGKIFQAIRDDETAAMTLGKNTYLYKVLSIAISTFFAAIAGSLFAHFIGYIDPTIFDLGFFVLILSMLITGGVASIPGTILGVLLISALAEAIHFVRINPEIVGAFREMVYILIVLLILIFRPKGLLGKVDV